MEKKGIECVDCNSGISVESLTDRLVLKDKIASIAGVEGIMEQVIRKRSSSRALIGDEMMRFVAEKHLITADEEKQYREALIDDYERRITEFM